MVSTIQLSNETKQELKEIKSGVSYEQIIKELIRKNKKQKIADDMKEYGQKYGDEEAKEVEEWHHTSPKW